MEVKVTNDNFNAEVIGSGVPVLVDFSAVWCGPCQMLAPILSEVAAERSATLKVCKIDVDEAPELAAKYGITNIPALLLFKNGTVVATAVGYMSKPDLEAFISQHS